jgi:hypothetical protein
MRARKTTHGKSKTREYGIYHGAKSRCTNPNHRAWRYYGGRGIEFRLPEFALFFAKLRHCPPGWTLERVNNDGHYEFGNVKWATRREQANNQRNNRKYKNQISIAPRPAQTAAQCATKFNVPLAAVQALQVRLRVSVDHIAEERAS